MEQLAVRCGFGIQGMLGLGCRFLDPFPDMAVVLSGVKEQANHFFVFPPYYGGNSHATTGWQGERYFYWLCQGKLAGLLQGHAIRSQLHAASGETEIECFDFDFGGKLYARMLTSRREDRLDAGVRPTQGRKLPQEAFYGHFDGPSALS
jgi:hypothetical protein